MNGREYDELKDWEKAFYDLNMKIGNDVWGAEIEGDGNNGTRLRVYVNTEKAKEKVLEETKGFIADYPIVFTIHSQDEYAKFLARKDLEENNEHTTATTS